MLASAETIEVVAKALVRHNVKITVIDPVCYKLLLNVLSTAVTQ